MRTENSPSSRRLDWFSICVRVATLLRVPDFPRRRPLEGTRRISNLLTSFWVSWIFLASSFPALSWFSCKPRGSAAFSEFHHSRRIGLFSPLPLIFSATCSWLPLRLSIGLPNLSRVEFGFSRERKKTGSASVRNAFRSWQGPPATIPELPSRGTLLPQN
jgi:hypothetical protein